MATIRTTTNASYTGEVNVSSTNNGVLTVSEVEAQDNVAVGTVDQQLALGSITNPVYLLVSNQSTTGSIGLSFDSGSTHPISIGAGQAVSFGVDSVSASNILVKSSVSGSTIAYIAS